MSDDTPQDEAVQRVKEETPLLELPAASELEDSLSIGVTEDGVAIMTMNAETGYGSAQRREVCHLEDMERVFRERFAPLLRISQPANGDGGDIYIATSNRGVVSKEEL